MACSLDGQVAYVEIDQSELGTCISQEKKQKLLLEAYGDLSTKAMVSNIVESPAQLRLEMQQQTGDASNGDMEEEELQSDSDSDNSLEDFTQSPSKYGGATPLQAAAAAPVFTAPSTAAPAASTPVQQVVHTLPDGRRRIVPQLIGYAMR
jgi:hypothetical protein